MNCLICPVCSERLDEKDKSYICIKNHTFDKSKNNYVNLLQVNHKNSKIPGDNKLMVNSRRDFLNKGYYSPMMRKLCEICLEYTNNGNTFIDAGCGEGYYTENVYNYLREHGVYTDMFGIDISKNALAVAGKRSKDIKFATASIFRMPFADNSADTLITLFAPYCQEEFLRVIKKNGIMIMVIPSEKHLWSLKKVVYENPYKNEVKGYDLEGFKLVKKELVKDVIHIENNQDIMNLFSMTPYYYKTGVQGQQKLAELDILDTETEFEILVYRKD